MANRSAPAAPKQMRRPATYDHLRKRERPESWVPIYGDAESQSAAEAEESLNRAIKSRKGVEDARVALAAAETARDASATWIHLRAIGDGPYEALRKQHPPTKEQQDQAAAGVVLQYDPSSFAPALIAATVCEPTMTPEEVRDILDEWTGSDGLRLWTAAVEVNNRSNLGAAVHAWGKGSNGTRG